ncbi:MAG: Na+/H+ antiporter subunit D [Acidimicrobiia bacterium]
MNQVIALPVALPLLGAGISIVFGRWRSVQRIIAISILSTTTVLAIVLAVHVDRHGTSVAQAGGWPAPLGITLVADRLATLMLAISAIVQLFVLIYAIGQGGPERAHVGFHPVYLVLCAGVGLAFLTGDLFNLFVAFEVMLTASYVLLTLGGRATQVRTGMTYVVVSLLASTLFLMTLALVYMATGTVNLAQLSDRMGDLPDGVRQAFGLLLIAVFGVKAAIFPLYFWLPDSYPTAPSPITAVFAGLLTKVGVYAIIRTQTLLVLPSDRPGTLLLIVAGATMIVGVLGAIAQNDVKRVLSFHIVSQIGYMVMGLGLFTVAGLAGAILYITHHIVVKTTLFLTSGLIERTARTGRLARMEGLAHELPVLAVLFLVPAWSLAGLPPFSGFFAKLALVRAGIDADQYAIVAVSLVVSLLTLFSMTKIWTNAFWGESYGDGHRPLVVESRLGPPVIMTCATAALASISIAIGVMAGPLYRYSERVAAELLQSGQYVGAVLG